CCCCYVAARHLRSLPTRRSSDLLRPRRRRESDDVAEGGQPAPQHQYHAGGAVEPRLPHALGDDIDLAECGGRFPPVHHHDAAIRSEEHTSELQSRENLVCRLLLE